MTNKDDKKTQKPAPVQSVGGRGKQRKKKTVKQQASVPVK